MHPFWAEWSKAQGPSGAGPAAKGVQFFCPSIIYPAIILLSSTLFYSSTMEQIPLRGPEDGAISLHTLGASAAISIAPLQHVCSGGAMEIAPSSGPGNENCSLVGLYYKVLIITITYRIRANKRPLLIKPPRKYFI